MSWTVSAIMYTGAPPVSLTCRSNESIGAAAYLTGRAPRTSNSMSRGPSRSAGPLDSVPISTLTPGPPSRRDRPHARTALTPASRQDRPRAEPLEELGHGDLDAAAARDPLPVRLDRARELVAAVDRRDHEERRIDEPIDDQALDVGLEPLEHRVELAHPAPRVEVQLRLGRPARARVHRDHA